MDWSFAGHTSSTRAAHGLLDARSLHWYPATYIPEIPYTLIELLSQPGDKVLDPFAGVGTTLWQAQSLGREAYGGELTTVGFSICRAVWTLTSDDTDLQAAQDEVVSVLRDWQGVDLSEAFLATERGGRLAPWFSPGTFVELAYLADAELKMRSRPALELLRLGTSSVLASVSEQRRGWGCIADNMLPRPADVQGAPMTRSPVERVIQKVRTIIRTVRGARARRALLSTVQVLASEADTHLFPGDCLQSGSLQRSAYYDLVVTSPPYPSMVDYSTAQRLSYYLNGSVPEADVPREIGARRRRFSSSALRLYASEMEQVFEGIADSLRTGGLLAMVVPEFTSKDDEDVRPVVLEESLTAATRGKLALRWETNRLLPASRRHLNQKWTSLRREQIRVFERI